MTYFDFTKNMNKSTENKFMTLCYVVARNKWLPAMSWLEIVEAVEFVYSAWDVAGVLTDKQREGLYKTIGRLRQETDTTLAQIVEGGWQKYCEINHCD